MPVILIVLIICTFFPLIPAWIAGFSKFKQLGKIDNSYPRLQQVQLSGLGARAVGAQENSWEALITFSVAVLTAFIAGVDLSTLDTVAWLFLIARTAYLLCYLVDFSTLRSLLYMFGLGCCIHIFSISAAHF